MFWVIFAFLSGIKLLFIPAYRSTDFEVHRNWLAITHGSRLWRSYYEETSEWTLDYPPFFAYFEHFLSYFAQYVDPEMLVVSNLNYASHATIVFQRLSVIVTDVVFALGVKLCIDSLGIKKSTDKLILAGLLLGNVGLLYVDHIHFQYNGFLMGFLLLSIAKMLRKQYIQSALLFCVLLNLKHIFLYIAPAYIVFLFKHYCLKDRSIQKCILNLSKLAGVIGLTLMASFGPFYKDIPQILSRLFPFKRGLTHAYWAPNFWALYNFADKGLSIILKKGNSEASFTGGLVKEYSHAVLPSISPLTTFVLTLIFMSFCAWKLFRQEENGKDFIRAIVLCSCTSFLFGWHVHEKAILMVLIPMMLLAATEELEAKMTIFLGVVAHYSLFPLLFKPELTMIKLFMHLAYTFYSISGSRCFFKNVSLTILEKLYLFGLLLLFVYETVLHNTLRATQSLPFLPLMLTSVYCSLGVIYFYAYYYWCFLSTQNVVDTKKTKIKAS